VKTEIDSSHCLELPYKSKCQNKHGHRWHIVVEMEGEPNEYGMIIDFSEIKNNFKRYDHQDLNEIVSGNPTAENLVKLWLDDLKEIIARGKYKVSRIWIQVAETPNNIIEAEIDLKKVML
jgi:6-pyruvoyltetrahydropterin/6-carboxytetrahydropterin synthase